MGSSNVLEAKIKKEMNVIKALIKANDYVFLVCGFDQNGNPHLADFGTQKEIFNKLTGEPLNALVFTLEFYFEVNDLKKNKPYALKLYVESGELVIEYFGGLNEMLPTLGKVS